MYHDRAQPAMIMRMGDCCVKKEVTPFTTIFVRRLF